MSRTITRLVLTLAVFLTAGVLYSAPAAAQATRTWISGVGDDVNPCSRTAPCKTFAGAISKTAAGGEINCLDPGGFGAVTITKSISLICDANPEAGIVVAGTSAIIVNSPTAHVVISGLDIEGLGNANTTAGIHGVNIINAASVTVKNTQIRGFRNGYGINFAPQNPGALLFVDNVRISEGGSAGSPSSTGGLFIGPAVNQDVKATITNTLIANNFNAGIRVENLGSKVEATVVNTRISNDQNGILFKVNAGTTTMFVNSSTINYNDVGGLRLGGAGAPTVRVSNTVITGNAVGVATTTGQSISYGNNQVGGNTSDGSFSSTLPNN